jgi:hypothetical protein
MKRNKGQVRQIEANAKVVGLKQLIDNFIKYKCKWLNTIKKLRLA